MIQVILEIIADKYCKEIINNALEKPKSAIKLSCEKKISISGVVYGRLQPYIVQKPSNLLNSYCTEWESLL